MRHATPRGEPAYLSSPALALSAAPDAPLPTEFLIFRAGDNHSTKGTFTFDARAAQMVLAADRLHGVDHMIDLEHFSLSGLDSDARGWFQLDVRAGELWAKNVTWTSDGARRLRERTQRYLSPAFTVETDAKSGITRPTELFNVALCAMPALHNAMPLAASQRSPRHPSDVTTPLVSARMSAQLVADVERVALERGWSRSAVIAGAVAAGLASLSDIEQAAAADIADPEHKARYLATRIARRTAAQKIEADAATNQANAAQRDTRRK